MSNVVHLPDKIYRDESWRQAQLVREHARSTALEAYIRAENARRRMATLIAALSCACVGLSVALAAMLIM
jgi:hypothetical protein